MERSRAMTQEPSVTTWIGQLRAGDEAAARPLWERYYTRLINLARTRLKGASRRVADEEDVALAAFHSLCRVADRFPKLSDRHDLWQILMTLVARKAFQERRRQQTLKRGGVEEADGKRCPQSVDGFDLNSLIAAEPGPELATMLAEEFERRFAGLPDESLREVARLRLEGYSVAEIALRLKCSERTAERKLSIIRGFWEQAES